VPGGDRVQDQAPLLPVPDVLRDIRLAIMPRRLSAVRRAEGGSWGSSSDLTWKNIGTN